MSTNVEALVERSIYRMMLKYPYYGAMLQSFKLCVTDQCPTASVSFDKGGKCIVLKVSPKFFLPLTEEERVALLQHEVAHVDGMHLLRMGQLPNWQRANIAADLSINCFIKNLPEGGCYPKDFKLPDFLTLEQYYEKMPDDDESGGGGKGGGVVAVVGTLDDHSEWGTQGMTLADGAEIIEQTIMRAMEKLGRGAADMPSHVAETLKAVRRLKVKDWHRELRKFLGTNATGTEPERSWSRRNRRWGLLEAGTKSGRGKKVAVCFDTSGSMSTAELERCLSETLAMVQRGCGGHIVQFDTKVNKVEPLRAKQTFDVVGRGGTNFTDLFQRVDELRCDCAVIFTDGDDYGEPAPQPDTPILWVYTDGRRNKYKFGAVTVLDRTA